MLHPFILAFFYGLSISFMGTLPPGNINIFALHIAAKENAAHAGWFALGVSLIEILYLRATFYLLKDITENATLIWYFRVATILLLLGLSVVSLWKRSPNAQPASPEEVPAKNKLLMGMLMSLMNPLQVVFWLGWITWMTANHVISANENWYHIFSLGSGVGTLLALMLFILAGRKLASFFRDNSKRINICIGAFFLLLAIMQIKELF